MEVKRDFFIPHESSERLLKCYTVVPKLITINAWNEWVEGSYLEPDERFGMQYLEVVRDVFVSPEIRKPQKFKRIEASYHEKVTGDFVGLRIRIVRSWGWVGECGGGGTAEQENQSVYSFRPIRYGGLWQKP